MLSTALKEPFEIYRSSLIIIIIIDCCQVLQTMKQDYPDIPIYIESTDMSSLLCNQEERITCIKPPSWCRNSCVYNHLIHHVDGEGMTLLQNIFGLIFGTSESLVTEVSLGKYPQSCRKLRLPYINKYNIYI